MTIFKEGDLVRFWTKEECKVKHPDLEFERIDPHTNWGEVGEVVRVEDAEMYRVEFSKPMYTRNIGAGALTLVKSLEDRIKGGAWRRLCVRPPSSSPVIRSTSRSSPVLHSGRLIVSDRERSPLTVKARPTRGKSVYPPERRSSTWFVLTSLFKT